MHRCILSVNTSSLEDLNDVETNARNDKVTDGFVYLYQEEQIQFR